MKTMRVKNATGHRIRQLRQSGTPVISQTVLAQRVFRLGVTMDQGALSRIENRTRRVTDFELIAFAKCLRVSVDTLCEGKQQKAACSSRLP